MPEQPTARVARRASRMTRSLALRAAALRQLRRRNERRAFPPASAPAPSEPDFHPRLACYAEMARLPWRQAVQPAASPPPAPPPPPAAPPPPPQSSAPPASAMAQAPRADVSTPATSPAAHSGQHGGHRASPSRRFGRALSAATQSRVTAHVASLDRSPNSMVLHLDNGQVWQQIGRASGDLTLRVGDSVTIERHLGSYWLLPATSPT